MMSGFRTLFISLFFFPITFSGFGQSQAEYLEAKRLYGISDYSSAVGAFNSLKEDPTFGTYARFYLGLSLYNNQNFPESISVLEELIQFYPDWEHLHEVLYWLSKINFEQEEYRKGLEYLDAYELRTTSGSVSDEFVPLYLSSISLEELVSFYDSFSENRALAILLATKLKDLPIEDRDQELLESILGKYEIPTSALIDEELVDVFKERYTISVVMPFMFDSYDNPGSILRNTLVTDFYQGMMLAAKELEKDSIYLDLIPFDTKRNKDHTISLTTEIAKSDVIVGPLLPPQVEAVKEISRENQINMINPLSSNDDYLKDNPYAFLFRSSYSTMARELAKYVVETDTAETAAVYFSRNPRDSTFAEIYRSILEEGGKQIVDFRSIDELEAKALLDVLTDQYEEFLDKDFADSLLKAEVPGRFIKFRSLNVEEEENLEDYPELDSLWFPEMDEEGNVINEKDPRKMVAYEMKFTVPKDSIGSFMVATRSNTIVNNIISAVAAREDSAGVYGYGDWFDFKVVNYDLMERLEVTLAMPEYLDRSTVKYDQLGLRFREEYASLPSDFHFSGYEFTYFIGHMLRDYGKYFQNGFLQEGVRGYLTREIDFKGSNNNQVVPFIKMRNFQLVPVR